MTSFSFSRFFAIASKEFYHIIYDPRSLLILLAMPVLQLVIFGYAMNMEIQNIPLTIYDLNHSEASRKLIHQFQGNGFFTIDLSEDSPNKVNHRFLMRKARAALVIPQDFDAKMQKQIPISLQLIIDASDPNAGTLIRNYCTQVIARISSQSQIPTSGIDIRTDVKYNPKLTSSYFYVPGLMALILIMICALLTSITISREKETGSMEQLLVSPIQPIEMILGKIVPYIFLSLIIANLILAIGYFLFQVPFNGSYLLLMLFCLVYISVALSLGILISAIAESQQVAMMFAIIITMLPTVMLSGFTFPIASMPIVLQYFSYLSPARYFLPIARGIILKGNTITDLLPQISILLVINILLITAAWIKFSKQYKSNTN